METQPPHANRASLDGPSNGPSNGLQPIAAAWQRAESHCIKCGFCLPACPTYRILGTESASPRGRLDLMAATARGDLGLGDISERIGLCLGCLACETACPAGIAFGPMLEAAQAEISAGQTWWRRWMRGLLLNQILARPMILRMLVRALAAYQRWGMQRILRASRLLTAIAPRLAALEARMPPLTRPYNWRREVAAFARHTSNSRPDSGVARDRGLSGSPAAALFTGCVMDAAFGAVHAATAKVIALSGAECRIPRRQRCCGALHAHAGDRIGARRLAMANIEAFEHSGTVPIDAPIVVNAAGCGAFLKRYGELFAGQPQWAQRAEDFATRVRDVSEYLAARDLPPCNTPMPLRVVYDDACHLIHAQGIHEQPRELLESIAGLELVTLPEEGAWCCGSAGSYSLRQPAMSKRILERKMSLLVAANIDLVATANPGCQLQLALGARDSGVQLRVCHPIELLAEAYS